MEYLGDFRAGATVRHVWNTNAVAGESITRATNGSIRVYKNSSTTERTSSAGITDTEDFDTLTGVHHLSIDLSDNTDAGFYAAGSDYFVVLQGATIDGKSINAALASFSIENRNPQVDVTKIGGSAQSATDLKDFADDGYDPATNKVQGVVLVDTLTTYTGNTPQTGDAFARIGAAGAGLTALGDTRIANLDAAVSSRLAPTVAGRTLDVTATGAAGIDWANVENSTTAVDLGGTTVALATNAITSSTIASGSFLAGKFGDDFLTAAGLAADAVAEIADAVWDELRSGHTIAGSFGQGVASVQGAVTGNVGGNVTGSVGSVASGVTVTTNNDKTGYALTAGEHTSIADACLDRADAIETGLTPRQSLRLIVAADAGKLSGAATTTVVIRNAVADSKNRITATVDASGNRSAITYDVS